MSVARISGPQLLDVPLWPPQTTVDQEGVGVSGDLRRDPGDETHQSGRQSLAYPEDPLEARKADLHLLPLSALLRALGHQQDAEIRQGLFQSLTPVGQISEEPASQMILPQVRSDEELFAQPNFGNVGGGKLVGEWHPVGSAESRCNFTPYTEKEPHLTQAAPSNPLECSTCLLGCKKTESSVES